MKYAIIADIHEDLVHLQLTLRKIEKLKCDQIICLGDISGFSVPFYHYYDTRNASECLRLVRKNCSIIVAGNHDLNAARKVPEFSPEFKYPNTWFKMDFHERLMVSKGKIWLYEENELDPLYTINDLEYLRSIPEYMTLPTEKGEILLTHYLYPNLTGSSKVFFSEHTEFNEHRKFMKSMGCKMAFAGHRHFAGLIAATKNEVIRRRYNSRHYVQEGDCIHIPQIAGNKSGNGFCVFDTDSFTIKTIRI